MTDHREAVDALITAFDSLTGLLYTVAAADGLVAALPQREAARSLADRIEFFIPAISDRDVPTVEFRRSSKAIRHCLALVAGVADDLAQGVIDGRSAAPTLFELVEHLGRTIDLTWVSATASGRVRRLLPTTVELIGELVVGDRRGNLPGDAGFGVGERRAGARTVTMRFDQDATVETQRAVETLQAAGVPYSIVEEDGQGRAYESLWLPGMDRPLRRRVPLLAAGSSKPILTWDEHIALLSIADHLTGYSELVATYLACSLHDAKRGVATLSRIAEAIADAE
jgi:hypothetical protein